jgi:hypothetical protein
MATSGYVNQSTLPRSAYQGALVAEQVYPVLQRGQRAARAERHARFDAKEANECQVAARGKKTKDAREKKPRKKELPW